MTDSPINREAQVTWHDHAVSRGDRETLMGHAGCVLWFTGLSGCGKSTVANCVDQLLLARGIHAFLLDGDNIRHGLNASTSLLTEAYGQPFAERFGLGFQPDDRRENIRRIAAVAQLFAAAGLVTLTAFVSPYRADREAARREITSRGQAADFIEIFVDAPLAVCEQRDPKGLYQQARAGKIKNFTGIHDPYETPLHPELVLDSANENPKLLAQRVVRYLESSGKIPSFA